MEKQHIIYINEYKNPVGKEQMRLWLCNKIAGVGNHAEREYIKTNCMCEINEIVEYIYSIFGNSIVSGFEVNCFLRQIMQELNISKKTLLAGTYNAKENRGKGI